LTRSHDQTGGEDRIVHEALQIGWLQGQQGIERYEGDRAEDDAGSKIAVAKQRRSHERPFSGEGMNQKKIESRTSDERFDDDFA
jgi:hypothetical protein